MTTREPVILALVFDLFFVSRIESVAERIGAQVKFWGDIEAPPVPDRLDEKLRNLTANLDRPYPDLILLDLSAPTLPWEAWLERLRALDGLSETPLVAFGSHVQVDLLARARAAGATVALAKSRFTAQMPQILGKYLP